MPPRKSIRFAVLEAVRSDPKLRELYEQRKRELAAERAARRVPPPVRRAIPASGKRAKSR